MKNLKPLFTLVMLSGCLLLSDASMADRNRGGNRGENHGGNRRGNRNHHDDAADRALARHCRKHPRLSKCQGSGHGRDHHRGNDRYNDDLVGSGTVSRSEYHSSGGKGCSDEVQKNIPQAKTKVMATIAAQPTLSSNQKLMTKVAQAFKLSENPRQQIEQILELIGFEEVNQDKDQAQKNNELAAIFTARKNANGHFEINESYYDFALKEFSLSGDEFDALFEAVQSGLTGQENVRDPYIRMNQ